jgi:hypothetical protein
MERLEDRRLTRLVLADETGDVLLDFDDLLIDDVFESRDPHLGELHVVTPVCGSARELPAGGWSEFGCSRLMDLFTEQYGRV